MTGIAEPEREPQGSFSLLENNDEQIIKTHLLRGSGFQDSKIRIFDFANTNPTAAVFARFLQNEYGTGGSSGYGDILSEDHGSGGIMLKIRDAGSENGERIISLTWNNAARRITELVNSGEYMPNNELLWRQYQSLLYEYRDSIVFKRLGDFYEVMGWDAKKVADELGFTLTSRDMGLAERVQLLGIPAHTLDTVVNELVKRDYHIVVADGETVTEHRPITEESVLPDDNADLEIDDYAIPDEPESHNRSGGFFQSGRWGYAQNQGQTMTEKREYKIKPEQINRLPQNGIFVYDNQTGSLMQSHII